MNLFFVALRMYTTSLSRSSVVELPPFKRKVIGSNPIAATWPVRISVSSRLFHSREPGSTPGRVTKNFVLDFITFKSEIRTPGNGNTEMREVRRGFAFKQF